MYYNACRDTRPAPVALTVCRSHAAILPTAHALPASVFRVSCHCLASVHVRVHRSSKVDGEVALQCTLHCKAKQALERHSERPAEPKRLGAAHGMATRNDALRAAFVFARNFKARGQMVPGCSRLARANVCVDHRCLQVLVPQQLLNRADVVAGLEQMSRKNLGLLFAQSSPSQ